jgi:hypothetical protein
MASTQRTRDYVVYRVAHLIWILQSKVNRFTADSTTTFRGKVDTTLETRCCLVNVFLISFFSDLSPNPFATLLSTVKLVPALGGESFPAANTFFDKDLTRLPRLSVALPKFSSLLFVAALTVFFRFPFGLEFFQAPLAFAGKLFNSGLLVSLLVARVVDSNAGSSSILAV